MSIIAELYTIRMASRLPGGDFVGGEMTVNHLKLRGAQV